MQLQTSSTPARELPNAVLVVDDHGKCSRHEIRSLSVRGARVTGRLPRPGRCVRVTLKLPLYPAFAVRARVTDTGLFFLHESDVTEDHIQAALLSELERKGLPAYAAWD